MLALALAVGMVASMGSAPSGVLSDDALASTQGAAIAACYKFDSEACPGGSDGPVVHGCILTTTSIRVEVPPGSGIWIVQSINECIGGCDPYCEQYQSKTWCAFTGNVADKCDFSMTQLCPPGTWMSSPQCATVGVASCPACSYAASGSC
jgi:hypothetical protein